jgi:putative dehydrogenase
MTTIAFVGLGAMGLPMAGNLAKAGFTVRGFDTRNAAGEALATLGGEASASAAAASRDAQVLILMVVDAAQARSVLFEAGALDALAPDGLVILMATCPPKLVAALARDVEATGRPFLDAPVSGGVVGARAGGLTIMAAAPKAVFDRADPILQRLGTKVFHVGEEPGQGATLKAVNQLLCGVHIAVVAEAFSLARKAGLDGQTVLDILSGSAASSWMLKDRGPRMLQDEPPVTSAVDIFVKDLGIVLEAGREQRVALPLASTAMQLFLASSGRGEGGRDDSQVIRSYDLLNGNVPS